MKTQLLKSFKIVFGSVLILGAASSGRAQCCQNFSPFLGVTVHAYAGCTDNNTPFTVTLDPVAGMPIPAGSYSFWCIDDNNVDIGVPYNYSNGTLYPSCGLDLTAVQGLRQPSQGSFANIAKINYILNNPGAATYVDIQNAIWHYIGGPPGPNFLPCYNYTPFPTAAYDALIAGADANPNYLVPCGGVSAVIIALPDTNFGRGLGPVQHIVIAVPCCCVTVTLPSLTVCQETLPATLTASASGGKGTLHYSWTGPNGAISGNDQATLSVNQAGSYSVTVTDDGGCSSGSATNTVTVNLSPSCTVSPASAAICAGSTQTFTVNPTGGSGSYVSYLWTDQNNSTVGTSPSITVSTPGTYTVVVVDSKGCTTKCSATLSINPPPTVTVPNVTVCANGTAHLCADTTGSLNPISSYSWTDASGQAVGNTQCIDVAAAGTYTVTVIDSKGCQASSPVGTGIVTIEAPIVVTVTPASSTTASQQFCASATGGSGNYTTYSWSGPNGFTASGSCITVSTPGTYKVVVSDDIGCSGSGQAVLTQPCVGSICGVVYADCDGSGDLTGGDVGYKNVTVTLKDAQGNVIATTTTGVDGKYCFNNLSIDIQNGTKYCVCIVQPSNCAQTGGTTTRHWKDNYGRTCWKENDGYFHCKDSNNYECWTANDGCLHWKDSYGRDCWKDRSGYTHWQNCNYTSCNSRRDNSECVTLTCQNNAITDVNFSYMGIAPKIKVCVTGPSWARCGDTITYTCKVSNLGNVCFTGGCKVWICGQWVNCPNLSPGQDWSCTKSCTVGWGWYGSYNCNATATCYPASGGSVSDCSSWSTQVGWW